MGREALCTCKWNDTKYEVKVLLEPPDLIIRGSLKRKVPFAKMKSVKADGEFLPVEGNPVQVGERACLFQHIFNGKYYGYQSHLDHATEQWGMEVLIAPLPK